MMMGKVRDESFWDSIDLIEGFDFICWNYFLIVRKKHLLKLGGLTKWIPEDTALYFYIILIIFILYERILSSLQGKMCLKD